MNTTIARAFALGVAVVALAACGRGEDGGSAATPTSTAATTAAPQPTNPREPLSSTSRLRVDGLGPITIGMSIDEARAAAGVPLAPNVGPYCTSLATGGGVALLSAGGTNAVDVIVVDGGPVRTLSGIGIGSTEAEVLSAYGSQLQVGPSDAPTRRIVYRATDPALADRSLVFHVRAGRVILMQAGVRSVVEADEMCG